MFIGMRRIMLPSSVRSDIRAPDVAPGGARAIKTITIYKHCAPPERENTDLCRNLSRTVCATPADAFMKNEGRK